MKRLGFAIAVVLAVATAGVVTTQAAPFGSDQRSTLGTASGDARTDVPRGPYTARSGPGFSVDIVCRDATLFDTIPPGRGRVYECLPDGSPSSRVPH